MKKLGAAAIFFAGYLGCSTSSAQASTLFMGAYPSSVLVFDESKGAVTQHIKLDTGLPRTLFASMDKKKIYVYTNDHTGIEVVDVATRKVINHFELNDNKTYYRFATGTPDPTGKFFYAVMTKMDKQIDRWEVGKPKFVVIDLDQKKIVNSYDIEKEDETAFRGGRSRLEISTDGKYIYQFG